MTKHFSEVICPFRGGFVLVHRPGGSPPREIWKDMRCVGPGQTLDAGTEPQASHKTAEVAQCAG